MKAYTAGPWIRSKHGFNILTADARRSIAAVHSINPGHSNERDIEEHLANAALIAAAPELLEILQSIIDIGKRDLSNPKYDGYFRAAKEVIAKAHPVK